MLVFDINRFGTKREIDDNGYLRVSSCNITKSQIRPYYGREIPGWRDFELDPDTIYNVYCPEEELKKALESFNNLPLTREHIEVDVENVPKDKIVGSLGDRAEYKKPYVKNSLIVYDKKDIDWILSGKKKELSCGYRYTPVRQSGEFDGKHYDFVMTDIIGNHVALVREGRAGHDVMVADENPNFTESQNDNTINTKENEMLTTDEFKEADHPRDDSGRFTDKSGSSSGEKKEERGTYENFKSPIANKIGNWYGPQGEESADKARAMREMEWTAHKIKTENNPEEKKELERDLDWEKSQFEKKFGEKPEKYGFGGSEKKEESSKETAVEKMYKKLSEQGMKGEALEQAIYEKHGWEGVEEARMISEYESGNPKHSQKEQEELVKSLEEELGDYKKIVKNFEDQGETGIDYNHYKQMVERQEGALKQAKGQLEWIKRHTKKEMAKDKEIPEKAGKPEKAGDEVALNQGETKMAEEVKEAPAEKKVEETKKEEVVEDACKKAEDKKEVKPACDEKEDKRKLIDEIGGILKGKLSEEDWRTVIKKAEELAYNDSERSADDKKLAKDEDKKDLKGKEQKAFAEGVEYGEKKEKEEPKKLDSEHESEGMKKAEKEMAKDSALAMDVDAIKAQVREEVMADFKAREEARKAVRGFVGDVNVMAFDSAEDIYKFACGKSGMDLNEIVSFKDAFKGLSAGKSKALALDASPVSGSNEECLKDIRIA